MEKFIDKKQSEDKINQIYLDEISNAVQALKHSVIVIHM